MYRLAVEGLILRGSLIIIFECCAWAGVARLAGLKGICFEGIIWNIFLLISTIIFDRIFKVFCISLIGGDSCKGLQSSSYRISEVRQVRRVLGWLIVLLWFDKVEYRVRGKRLSCFRDVRRLRHINHIYIISTLENPKNLLPACNYLQW